jgi:hypothetical protein
MVCSTYCGIECSFPILRLEPPEYCPVVCHPPPTFCHLLCQYFSIFPPYILPSFFLKYYPIFCCPPFQVRPSSLCNHQTKPNWFEACADTWLSRWMTCASGDEGDWCLLADTAHTGSFLSMSISS